MQTSSSLKQATIKSAKGLFNALPLMLGTILLVGLITGAIPPSFYTAIFSKNIFLDSLIGSTIGSISAGNPITSYILAGELLEQGISLMAVTSFLVAWVTVGIIQLPAETMILGKRFALLRNLSAFVLSIVVATLTVLILNSI